MLYKCADWQLHGQITERHTEERKRYFLNPKLSPVLEAEAAVPTPRLTTALQPAPSTSQLCFRSHTQRYLTPRLPLPPGPPTKPRTNCRKLSIILSNGKSCHGIRVCLEDSRFRTLGQPPPPPRPISFLLPPSFLPSSFPPLYLPSLPPLFTPESYSAPPTSPTFFLR